MRRSSSPLSMVIQLAIFPEEHIVKMLSTKRATKLWRVQFLRFGVFTALELGDEEYSEGESSQRGVIKMLKRSKEKVRKWAQHIDLSDPIHYEDMYALQIFEKLEKKTFHTTNWLSHKIA